VVSADGPVTIYSDGASVLKVAEQGAKPLLSYPSILPSDLEHLAEEVTDRECTNCGKQIRFTSQALTSTEMELRLRCPVCEEDLGGIVADRLERRPVKPWEASIRARRNN